MEESLLYEFIKDKCVFEVKDKIKQRDGKIMKAELEAEKQKLEAALGDNGRKLLADYSLALENWFDYLNYHINIEILNTAIKIGMELQSAFNNDE